MTKFNFFLVVEALLLTLGLITIFNNDITSFIFILVLTLLAIRFFNKESKSDFVLTISLISLFLVSMWNVYVVLAILVGVAYVMINHFSQVKKKNRYALIKFKEDDLDPRAVRNQWIGTRMEPAKLYSRLFWGTGKRALWKLLQLSGGTGRDGCNRSGSRCD